MNDLDSKYYNWLVQLVCPDRRIGEDYRYILQHLYSVNFRYVLPMDANREEHATNFRYRFGDENGYEQYEIANELDYRPASILEIMVELAVRIEETIMQDDEYGDRTSIWFWDMMYSLGLDHMTNSKYDEKEADYVISRLLDRDYAPNGKGGLFTVNDPYEDMRYVHIWAQAQWYLEQINRED